jgi:hypothetical protein
VSIFRRREETQTASAATGRVDRMNTDQRPLTTTPRAETLATPQTRCPTRGLLRESAVASQLRCALPSSDGSDM